MERWQWRVCEFEAVQAHAGQDLPAGCVPGQAVSDTKIIGYVSATDGMSLPVRDKDWIVYDADGVRIRRVVSDERFQALAVRVDPCGS